MRVFDIARFFDGSIVRVKLTSGYQVRCILEAVARDTYSNRVAIEAYRIKSIRHWAPWPYMPQVPSKKEVAVGNG